MAAAQQVRLLLWKDYLIRRRKPITLAGVVWAALVLMSLYIVRSNIDNVQHPTCQFAARALPSAGVLPFLQSFVCSVNNECEPLDQYEEIPAYENASFTQIYREISPLINNATVTGTAATVPDALKLLATLADVADTPAFLHIVRKGLFVKDLFRSPTRVKRYLSQKLGVPEYVMGSVMDAKIGIDALFKGGIEVCDIGSMSRALKVKDGQHLQVLVGRLCEADAAVLQDLVMDLLFEMDLGKYVQMLGEMYYKLSEDDRLVRIAEMVAGALRMTSLDSFLPPELPMIFAGRDVDFSYINLTMITRLMEAFKPTFGETESYKSIREVADTTVIGMQYLSNFVRKSRTNTDDEDTEVKTSIRSQIKAQVGKIYQTVDSIGNAITDLIESDTFDIFKILPQVANIFIKWLSNDAKHEVILYSTMLAKLMQGAEKVVDININIEQWLYNASLRNPEGVKILLNLPPAVLGNGLEALADVDRAQIMATKLGNPRQMFCDTDRIEKFFLVSHDSSTQLKTQLCTDAWANFTNDLLQSFGIKEVKNNINNMAAIFILEALGKDTTDYLYTIDKDFEVLKNFTTALTKMDRAGKPKLDWSKVLNVSKNSESMKVITEKARLSKHMLITMHGTFAKEVVTQNPLLSFKIATHLKKATVVIEALKEQLNTVPSNVTTRTKQLYPEILQTVIATARNEDKSYLSLSTPWDEIFCNGEDNASKYLEFGANVNRYNVSAALCDIAIVIENALTNKSIIAKTIEKLENMKEDTLDDVHWNRLITGLNELYGKLYNDYTYIFEYNNFGMDEALQKKMKMELKQAINFWFNIRNLDRLMHIVLKFGFRLLDVMDHAAFNMTHEIWLKLKYGLGIVEGPVQIAHDVISVISNTLTKTDVHSDMPPLTASLIQEIAPNVPKLVYDMADLITMHDLDIEPVITILNASPSWPCSVTSMYEILTFNKTSAKTLQSVEALSCFNSTLQEEWVKYTTYKNISTIKTWNSTIVYPDHVFLKFSATFDLFVKDLSSINSIIKETFLVDKDDDKTDFAAALEYIITAVNNTDRSHFRKLLTKVDKVMNIIDTPVLETNITLNKLWMKYFSCVDDEGFEQCRGLLRLSVVRSMHFVSMTFQAFSEDLHRYLTEANEPNASILKMLGFTSNTGMFMLYDRFGDFVSILVNSYLDLGFMSQVYRASQLEFWDCEDVTRSIRPGPGSAIDKAVIRQLEPFLCPSLFYWLSTPIGDNILLDIIAKPQFFLFKSNISSFSSAFEEAYNKAMDLTDYAKELSVNMNVFNEKITLDKMRGKMESTLDPIFTFKINKTDDSYVSFANVTETQTYATIYLTHIATVANKFADYIDKLNVTDVIDSLNATEEDARTITYELNIIKKIPIRNPHHFVAFHFDLITYMLWENNENYTILDALKYTCDSWKNKANNTNIVLDNDRIKAQICSKNYTILYEPASDMFNENTEKARNSLVNFVRVLNKDKPNTDVGEISEFLKSRTEVIDALQTSVNYAHDLKIPVYLKYLHNNLRHYNVIVSFLSGGDWWSEFRSLYNTEAVVNEVLDTIENIFPIAEDIIANVDRIHIARLMHDINVNNTAKFCQANISVADYLPDNTRALRRLHRHICDTDRNEIITAIPPLHFAAQDFINQIKFSNEVDYDQIASDVDKISVRIKDIEDGPKEPTRPQWITDYKLYSLREKMLQIITKESFTRISFGVISNFVDAGTLFLNSRRCTLCSKLTTWFKQINLQLYKKQEYDNLLCQMSDHMTLEEIHNTLKYEFHWDMAFSELISTRNYTNHELNKSINEFLEQFKLHLLEDMTAGTTKITDCLAANATRNIFGNITLSARVLSSAAKLIRSQLAHLREVAGMTDVPFLQQLYADVAHNLQVQDAFNKYVLNNFTTHLSTLVRDQKLLASIENSRINLQAMPMQQPVQEYLTLEGDSWNDVCQKYNCSKLSYVISDNLNKTLIQNNLPKLQQQEFWKFNFISNIFYHVEVVLDHLARLMGVASQLDFEGVMAGNLTSLLDTGIQVMMDDSLNSLLYSIVGLLDELQVVLHNTTLEHDINAIAAGLTIIRDLKRYVIEQDMKVNLSQIFSNPEDIEKGLSQIGINNTNFWSIAAPRIHAGYIRLKPIFAPKSGKYQIKSFVCQVDKMASVIVPGNIDVVTVDDVYGAVADQLCGISDAQAKQMMPVLLENLNYTYIFGKLKANLLSKLYKVSNLTQEEGDEVFNKFGEMTEIIPTVQNKLGNVADSLSKEPLMMQLKRGGSFGDLLSGSDLLANTGKMMCGKPFRTELGRFYKAIVQLKDQNTKPDPAQLEIMPTDFCRDLYTQITSMDGGKIVWSYAKPLLFGKILYTPDVPVVKEIIQKANSTFAPMFKLVGIVHAFANTVPALEKLSNHRDGLKGFTDLLSSPQYSELLSNVIGNVTAPDVDVEKLFNSFGDINDITGMIKKASNMLRCFDLNRFRAVSNETELGHEAGKLTRVREFSAGLVFMNISEKDTKIPSNIEYKIRMDIENAPTTRRLKNFLWIPGPEANFLEDMRYFRGFIQIQDTIEKAIIELSINQSRKIQKRAAEGNEQTPMSLATYTQQTPYPCYIQDFFQTSLYASQALIVAFFFSLLLTVSSAVRFIVVDKETGNTMLMSVMGVNLSYHTLSWFVACALEMAVTVAVMTAVLYFGNVLPRTDPSLVFILFLIYGCSALSFCYMISKLFSSASFAAVCTGIAFLCTFMPFVIILSLEAVLTNTLKVIVSLSSSSSVCYALLYLTRYEATSAGAGWPQVWDSPDGGDNMSIGIATCMIIFDTFLYFIIGLILDPFLGIRTESNITTCQTVDEKPGVSIVNVTKVYGNSRSGKLALDGVSMELVKGQITALLGHNGAGKTTLVRILTGMLKPTSGHVIVRSADGSRTTLGVCPQGDVLYEYMTAEEHVALYAQLKSGRPLSEVQDEVDSLLDVLSLGEARREAAARLSGGTRRRLCVALAFVARPHLVSLDEPTAGVDPAARRDIWMMITRLRADRTILLTTHHLDEAELLSDQIVIMHKGQIHTTGSPIEIKRSLGSGYKLTVTYPDTRSEEDSSEEGCLEEKTKNLLATARSVVRNANLVDVNGLEVEINLPFYDQDGVSNDFPQLCCTLEEQQAALEFASYDMECSSLEQVFYNICHQADATAASAPPDNEVSSKSASTSSVRSDRTPLVPADGPLCASATTQLAALLHIRFLHYTRNRWLLFLLVALPSIFVTLAMAFSTVRPPADIELSLRLDRHLYEPTTDFVVMNPSIQGDGAPTMAQKILDTLRLDTEFRNWTEKDSPVCKCMNTTQHCDATEEPVRPQTMVFPDVHTLNRWLVDSQQLYINKRYGGFSGAIRNGSTSLVAWYNNKGHHAMPAYVNALHAAARRALTGDAAADITLHTHPLKISEEQINKDTVYQHVADAGISAMLVVGYSLVSAGGAVYLVTARRSREKRLQLLAGVSPALYWAAALIWDLLMILVNIGISALILELFHFPVFVERNNLPAICILIFLYGYACSGLVHLLEKLFSEPSLANMMLFCGNCFVGLAGITVLLILDIISDSDATDNARRVLHKVFMLSPQFALADGLLEVAKNTIQSQVLGQFGLDTYRDPLWSDLLTLHLSALVVVGTALIALNLAVEYDCFDSLMQRFRRKRTAAHEYAIDSDEVRAEAERVRCSFEPLRLRTIGNINAGYVVTETDMDPAKTGSLKRWTTSSSLRSGAGAGPGAVGAGGGDAAACVHLSRVYRTSDGHKHAVKDLTLGIPRGQCTALLGENGAGKSTTFAMLTGELRPTAGLIHLDGAPATPRDLCRGLISYCPQQDAIDPLLTVHETLRFYCRLRGIDNAKEVIKRTVEMFDLSKYMHVRSGALSGGNKRKLCTAIAFMGRTPLVLLDEPTSGMDPGSRGCVWRGVSAACGAGRAALLSTHALADARRTATRVALMRRARLRAIAPLDHCLKQFGGGWVCACRTAAGAARAAWRRIAVRAPASLQLLHDTALHVVLPEVATVEGKEVRTRLSAVFRLLSELQAAGLVRDYTVNRTDLDQMFLSYSDKQTVALEEWDGPHDGPHDGPRDGPHDGPHVRPRDGAYGTRDDDDVVTAL